MEIIKFVPSYFTSVSGVLRMYFRSDDIRIKVNNKILNLKCETYKVLDVNEKDNTLAGKDDLFTFENDFNISGHQILHLSNALNKIQVYKNKSADPKVSEETEKFFKQWNELNFNFLVDESLRLKDKEMFMALTNYIRKVQNG